MTRLADRALGAGFFLLAAWFWVEAGTLERGFGDPVGPTVFPRLVAAPMAGLGLIIALRPDPSPAWAPREGLLRQLVALVALFAYPALILPLGFPLASALGSVVLARLLGASWLAAVIVGAAIGPGLFVVFDPLLGLNLPFAPEGF